MIPTLLLSTLVAGPSSCRDLPCLHHNRLICRQLPSQTGSGNFNNTIHSSLENGATVTFTFHGRLLVLSRSTLAESSSVTRHFRRRVWKQQSSGKPRHSYIRSRCFPSFDLHCGESHDNLAPPRVLHILGPRRWKTHSTRHQHQRQFIFGDRLLFLYAIRLVLELIHTEPTADE